MAPFVTFVGDEWIGPSPPPAFSLLGRTKTPTRFYLGGLDVRDFLGLGGADDVEDESELVHEVLPREEGFPPQKFGEDAADGPVVKVGGGRRERESIING